jgi:hypothetical protein
MAFRGEGGGVFSNFASCIAIIVIVLFEGGEDRQDATDGDQSRNPLRGRHNFLRVLPFEVIEQLADLAVEPKIYL